jgi:hypothetical protein
MLTTSIRNGDTGTDDRIQLSPGSTVAAPHDLVALRRADLAAFTQPPIAHTTAAAPTHMPCTPTACRNTDLSPKPALLVALLLIALVAYIAGRLDERRKTIRVKIHHRH